MSGLSRYALLIASVWLVLTLAGCGGGGSAVTPVPPVANRDIDKLSVILLGWDGCQREHLQQLIAANRVPHLQTLISGGSMVDIDITTGMTATIPGWTEILTGYSQTRTGNFDMHRYRPIPAGWTIFERLERRYGKGIYTASLIGQPHYITPDLPRGPFYFSAQGTDKWVNGLKKPENVGAAVCEVAQQHRNGRFFIFAHFMEPDIVGHGHGENSEAYSASIVRNDAVLGTIMDKLAELGISERTLIYITADHGFNEDTRHHHSAPYVFLASNDSLVTLNGDRKDITPTILARFGVPLDKLRPTLDGHSLLTPNL